MILAQRRRRRPHWRIMKVDDSDKPWAIMRLAVVRVGDRSRYEWRIVRQFLTWYDAAQHLSKMWPVWRLIGPRIVIEPLTTATTNETVGRRYGITKV